MRSEATAPLIAVVDDEESIRAAMDSRIRSAGYRSVLFESGTALLDYGPKHRIDCLILDISMPGMNGLVVQHRLARMKCSIPTIVTFGEYDGHLLKMALKQGQLYS